MGINVIDLVWTGQRFIFFISQEHIIETVDSYANHYSLYFMNIQHGNLYIVSVGRSIIYVSYKYQLTTKIW